MRTATKRNPFANPWVNPFAAWTAIAFKTGEMMLHSAEVIAHRTRRMSAAGSNPTARDQREFALMGQEKIAAATESAQAMALQMMRTNAELGTQAFRQMLTLASDTMSLATSKTLAQSAARQQKLGRTLTQSAVTGARISDAVARVTKQGMVPIRSRAKANAKRLRGR